VKKPKFVIFSISGEGVPQPQPYSITRTDQGEMWVKE